MTSFGQSVPTPRGPWADYGACRGMALDVGSCAGKGAVRCNRCNRVIETVIRYRHRTCGFGPITCAYIRLHAPGGFLPCERRYGFFGSGGGGGYFSESCFSL